MHATSADLSGKAALVVGAGAGKGRAIALALANAGASVAAADINIERADATSLQIAERGGKAIFLRADISNRFQVANMIERTRDAFGGLHILVNAVCVHRAQPLLQIDEWDWRRQLEVNISGAFFCVQLAGRVMAAEGGGVIIHVVPRRALSPMKAGIGGVVGANGIVGLTQQAAYELAASGVRVKAIAAGEDPGLAAREAVRLCLNDAEQS